MPVVRWLQAGTVAAGIGIALAASSGTAFADDGAASTSDSPSSVSTGPAASEPSDADGTKGADEQDADEQDADEQDADEHDEADEDETVEEPETSDPVVDEDDDSADNEVQEAVIEDAADTDTVPVEEEAAPDETSDEAPVAASLAAPTTALAALEQPSCGCALNRALTATANWLALHPRVPFGPFLEAGVYLVRRTLFPASVGVITSPVKVKLHFTDTSQTSGENKLGIYLAMAGSTTPRLFEFDTGSAGLFAAYSEIPGVSPWWGDNFEDMGNPAGVTFDSGLVYSGTGATTAVSLFGSADSCTSVLNTGQVLVGQMDEIGTSTDPTAFWGTPGSTPGEPPVEGAFWGDFGMALSDRPDGIVNVISQLTFGWGVKPGFIVHVDPITNEAWMQVGLRRSDLTNDDTMFFAMDPDPSAPPTARVPNSHVRYYALQPFTATLTITGDEAHTIDNPFVPILPDTGASTTLHNTQSSPPPSPEDYKHLVDWTDQFTKGKLKTGLTFSLSGTTTSGQQVTFFEFGTSESTDGGRVGVQNEASVAPPGPTPSDQMYYLNSGRSMFNEYDLVYSLGNRWGGGTIGLLPHGLQTAERAKRYSK